MQKLSSGTFSRGKTLWKLFYTCFKIGLFTFGGGFAMIPLMEREFVDKQQWVSKKEFLDTISVTQSVPGAVAINLSIFFGYNTGGLTGAICAALGVALPSFIIITLIAIGFQQFSSYPFVVNAFRGIRPAVVALIIYAGLKLSKGITWSTKLVIVFFLVLILTGLFQVNPIYLILGAIITGMLRYIFSNKSEQQRYAKNQAKLH